MPRNDYKGAEWNEINDSPRATQKLTEQQTAKRLADAASREVRRLARRVEVKRQIAAARANEARAVELRLQVDSLDGQIAAIAKLIDGHEEAIAQSADVEELLDSQAEFATQLTRLRQHREAMMRSYLAVAKDSCASVYIGQLHGLSRPDLLAATQFARDSLAACESRITALHDMRGRFTNGQFASRMGLLIAERARCETEVRDAGQAALDE